MAGRKEQASCSGLLKPEKPLINFYSTSLSSLTPAHYFLLTESLTSKKQTSSLKPVDIKDDLITLHHALAEEVRSIGTLFYYEEYYWLLIL